MTVYIKQLVRDGSDGGSELVTWEFMAKYRSHYQPIESKDRLCVFIIIICTCTFSLCRPPLWSGFGL